MVSALIWLWLQFFPYPSGHQGRSCKGLLPFLKFIFPPLSCPHICRLTSKGFFKVSSFESSRIGHISCEGLTDTSCLLHCPHRQHLTQDPWVNAHRLAAHTPSITAHMRYPNSGPLWSLHLEKLILLSLIISQSH